MTRHFVVSAGLTVAGLTAFVTVAAGWVVVQMTVNSIVVLLFRI
jgi:hypothetical protein